MNIILKIQVPDEFTLRDLQGLREDIADALSAMPGKPVPATMGLELAPKVLEITPNRV